MTRERLKSLTREALQVLSEKLGLDTDPDTDRDTLIETIFDALEEDKIERQQLNNLVMRVKEKKYDISRDEELDFSEPFEYLIPEKYNETKLVLLLRDPLWAYAYWDLKEQDLNHFKNSVLFLRVHKATESEKGTEFFDIPLSVKDRSWYVNLPDTDCLYHAEIISEVFGEEKVLCKSNTVRSPRTEIIQKETEIQGNDDILFYSGLFEFGGTSSMSHIPQRIISVLDNQFLNAKE